MSAWLSSEWLWSALLLLLVSSAGALAQTPPRVSRPSEDAAAGAKTFHRKIQGPLRAILPDPLGAPSIAGPAQPSLNIVDADGRTAVRIRTDTPAAIVTLLERHVAMAGADVRRHTDRLHTDRRHRGRPRRCRGAAARAREGISATGVPAGTYYVRVIATNAAGQSTPSNEIVLVVSP